MTSPVEDTAYRLEPVVRRKATALGELGRLWLGNLPALIAELEAQWAIRVEHSLSGGTSAFVGAARTVDGAQVVLKLGLPDPDLSDEIGTLERARGRGYVHVLASDRLRNAILLERLGPRLSDAGLSPDDQLSILARLLPLAWQVPAPLSGPKSVPYDKATSLHGLVRRLWEQSDRPCSGRLIELALEFATRRANAFDPRQCVSVHGDAAAANAMRALSTRPGAESGYVFVDPDGFVGDPAYDVGVALRDWCAELLASSDPGAVARHYSRLLAQSTGMDEDAVWEWGFLERVSTGLYAHSFGAFELSEPFFASAEALASSPAFT
jgi:streptomycin 6-kinase